MVLLEQPVRTAASRTLSGADLVLQNGGALTAAEYGRLAIWEHAPLFSGLGAASIAAGRCISAGAPSRPLTLFHFRFQLLFVTRVLRLCSILVVTKNPKVCSLGLGFVCRFCCSRLGRALSC